MSDFGKVLCSFLVLVVGSVFAREMEFVPIPKREVYYKGDKYPVKLIQEFEMQTTEVTQLQYFKLAKANPSRFQGKSWCPGEYQVFEGVGMCPNHPVENVSWIQVQNFIAQLNAERDDGYGYRLPTAGEWNYATRAKSKGDYFFGGNPLLLSTYSWYWINSGAGTHAVGQKRANPWGLHDVYGNVWEWVSDDYVRDLPEGVTLSPGAGGSSGGYYVTRGGGWGSGPHDLRSNAASFGHRYSGYDFIGFRLLRIRIKN